MTVIFMNKADFNARQYNNVTRIDYDPDTKIYTIIYGDNLTTSVNGNYYIMSVLFS